MESRGFFSPLKNLIFIVSSQSLKLSYALNLFSIYPHCTKTQPALHFCKEQYCIGTWNVRSMNQSKLEVVKQEMARVNVDILGISELEWVNLTQMTIISTTAGRNPSEEME